MMIGDHTLTEQSAMDWADQPLFVIGDASHARIMARLQAGEEGVYSYNGTCPHSRQWQNWDPLEPLQCTCLKMLNVLRHGRMVRYVNGEVRPVLSSTELMALQRPQAAQRGFTGRGHRLDQE